MMLLETIINLAKAGELLQTGHKDTTIAANLADVIGYINLGLIEIYKRFDIKTGEAIITLRTGKYEYLLDGTDPDVVLTGGEPLIETEAYEEDGTPINFDEDSERTTIYRPAHLTLQIPAVEEGYTVSVIYRSAPDMIAGDADPALTKVPLGYQYLEAILHYIGYRAHGSINGAIQAENNTHYMRFDASCRRIVELGLSIQSNASNEKFSSRGFV